MKDFAKQVAIETSVKVLQALKANEALKTKEKEKEESKEEFWIESGNLLICNPCLVNSSSYNVPKKLKKYKRGTFGYVEKGGKPSDVATSKSRHSENPLHIWCANKFLDLEEKKTLDNQKNELVGKKIVRNALLCFKRSIGSEDFLALNELNFLAERDLGNEIFNVANKNDSRSEFFRLRNEVFGILSKKTIAFFDKIQDIAVTLDKAWTS